MHQQNEPTTNDPGDPLPGPPAVDWDISSATAVVEVTPPPPVSVDQPVSEPANPQQQPAQSAPAHGAHRRHSTSKLGGTFASIIFHLWLLAMLATLTGGPPLSPPAPAIDSVLIREDEAAPDPVELPHFE